MKKLGKILVLTLIVALFCAVAVIAASASDLVEQKAYTGQANGSVSIVKSSADGNAYYEYSRARGTVADFSTSLTNMAKSYSYIVFEIDFMSEDGYKSCLPGASLGMNVRNSGGGSVQGFGVTIHGSSDGSSANLRVGNTMYPFDPAAYVWHHVTMIWKIEDPITDSQMITYLDGKFVGVIKNGFAAAASRCDSMRIDNTNGNLSGEGKNGVICMDNFRYLTADKKYSGPVEKLFRNPAMFDLSKTAIVGLVYNPEYTMPYGRDVCQIKMLDGSVKKYDSFAKAVSQYNNGETIELLSDVKGVTIDRPMTVVPGAFAFEYTCDAYPPREVVTVNEVTGVKTQYIKFVRLTKNALYYWATDKEGTLPTTPQKIPVGALPRYEGSDLVTVYFDLARSVCQCFDGWKVFGKYDLRTVAEEEAGSTYYVYPVYKEELLYGILTKADGTRVAAISTDDVLNMIQTMPEGGLLTLTRDVTLKSGVTLCDSTTIDLNGKTLTFASENEIVAFRSDVDSFRLYSSVPGASIVMSKGGVLISSGSKNCTVELENITLSGCRVAELRNGAMKISGKLDATGLEGDLFDISGKAKLEVIDFTLTNVGDDARFLRLSAGESSSVTIRNSRLSGTASAKLFQKMLTDTSKNVTVTLDNVMVDGFTVETVISDITIEFARSCTFDAVSVITLDGNHVKARVEAEGIRYAIVEKTEAVEIEWMNDGLKEFWAVGEKPSHILPTDAHVDGDLFYEATGKYTYEVDGTAGIESDVVLAEWVGKTVKATAKFHAEEFKIAVKTGDVTVNVKDMNLDAIICGERDFGAQATVILGRSVLLPEFAMNELKDGDLTIDLNGHTIVAEGVHMFRRNVTFTSSKEGAKIQQIDEEAFAVVNEGVLTVNFENLTFEGSGTLGENVVQENATDA